MDDDPETQADLSAFDAADGESGERVRGDAERVETSDGESGEDAGPASDDVPGDGGSAPAARPVGEMDRTERVELGVELLANLETDELPLSAAVDRIETVTTNPTLTREILDAAELRGVIDREDGRILTRRGGTFVRFDSQVVRREGEFTCRRCGAGLSTGHFVRFDSGELGPFGSSCIEKVLGRA